MLSSPSLNDYPVVKIYVYKRCARVFLHSNRCAIQIFVGHRVLTNSIATIPGEIWPIHMSGHQGHSVIGDYIGRNNSMRQMADVERGRHREPTSLRSTSEVLASSRITHAVSPWLKNIIITMRKVSFRFCEGFCVRLCYPR